MSHTTILTDAQASMYGTALDVSIEANILDITGFSDELLDVISEMIQVEQAKRTTMLPSEILSQKYDAPHQRATDDDDDERSRLDSDRLTEHFEREPDNYVSSDDRGYSNPISL